MASLPSLGGIWNDPLAFTKCIFLNSLSLSYESVLITYLRVDMKTTWSNRCVSNMWIHYFARNTMITVTLTTIIIIKWILARILGKEFRQQMGENDLNDTSISWYSHSWLPGLEFSVPWYKIWKEIQKTLILFQVLKLTISVPTTNYAASIINGFVLFAMIVSTDVWFIRIVTDKNLQ